MKQVLILILMATIGLWFTAAATTTVPIQNVIAASDKLQTFQATIFMARYTGNQKAEIEFNFKFVPPAKMRIEYTAPKNLIGQLVILNGDKLYTYIPALRRAIRKTITTASSHPGTEMGFLYYFVNRDLTDFLCNYTTAPLVGPQPFTWDHGKDKIAYTAYKLTLTGTDESQVVWCDAATFVPIAVDIYHHGKLAIAVRVVNYAYNRTIPQAEFVIPK